MIVAVAVASAMDAVSTAIETVGKSSLVMVPDAVVVAPRTAWVGLLMVIVNVSSASFAVSGQMATTTSAVVEPAAIVAVPDVLVKSTPAVHDAPPVAAFVPLPATE